MYSWDVDDDEEEDVTKVESFTGVDLVVFLIDCSTKMKTSVEGK